MANDDLECSVVRFRQVLVTVRRTADDRAAAMAAGNVEHRAFDQLLHEISVLLRTLDEVAAVPGIGQFIKNFYGNQNIDLGVHHTAIVTAAETVAATIRSSAPADAQSFIAAYQYDSNPRALEPRIWRTYTPVQMATIRTELAALSTAISDFFAAILA